jgi:hypothetical protein
VKRDGTLQHIDQDRVGHIVSVKEFNGHTIYTVLTAVVAETGSGLLIRADGSRSMQLEEWWDCDIKPSAA